MKNRFVNNTMWQIGGRVIQMVIGIVVNALIARYLGPRSFGDLSYTLSYITFFTAFANLGINNVIIKELVSNRNQEGVILGTSLLMRIFSSMISLFTVIVLMYFITQGNSQLIWITVIQGLSLVFQQFELITFWYNSHLNSKISSIVALGAYIILTIYRIVLLITKANIYYFAFVTTFEQMALAFLLYLSYRKYSEQPLKINFDVGKRIFKLSHHFIYASLMATLYGQMDKIMLGILLNNKEVGFYSIAIGINSLWGFVIGAIISSAEPIIMKTFNEDKEKFEILLKKLYASVFYLSILAAIAINILAKFIILILYGEAFIPSIEILRIVPFIICFSYLGISRGIWIVCEQKQKYLKYMLLIGAFTNLILNYLLISRYGVIGAAMATLFTEFVVTFISPLLFKETRYSSKIMIDAILFR